MRKAKSIEQIKPMIRFKNALYVKKGLDQKVYKKMNHIERLFSILKQRYHLEDPRLLGYKVLTLNRYSSLIFLGVY